MRISAPTLVLAALLLSACTTTRQVADLGFQPPQGNYRLIVMQPDISVGALTAGGVNEPREDWTNQARENMLQALTDQQAEHGAQTRIAATRDDTGADPVLVDELLSLQRAVGRAIVEHKYYSNSLPTKAGRFDWTLGSRAVELGSAAQAEYALFISAQDSFSTGGRIAVQTFSVILSCSLGGCLLPTGGSQFAVASLVDLKTGQVVWFTTMTSIVGDIRTPEGSAKMVATLLGKMRAPPVPESNSKNSRRRRT